MAAYEVEPALESPGQAWGFALLLALVLLSPFASAALPLDQRQVLAAVPPIYTGYRHMADEMESEGAIDILLIGASSLQTGVDPVLLGRLVSKELGKEVYVTTFGSSWRGEESYFAQAKALVAHRRVRLVVGAECDTHTSHPHELAKYWWLAPRYDLRGPLPLRSRAELYTASIIGAPRLLWVAAIGGPARLQPTAASAEAIERTRRRRGHHPEERGWLSHHTPHGERAPYERFSSDPPRFSAEQLIYEPTRRDGVSPVAYGYTQHQTYFTRRMVDTFAAHGASYVALAMPLYMLPGQVPDTIRLREYADGPRTWPVIGVSVAALFPGKGYDEIVRRWYLDETHLNANGAELYTKAIAPAVAELYRRATRDAGSGKF